jgi:hypothetical protein
MKDAIIEGSYMSGRWKRRKPPHATMKAAMRTTVLQRQLGPYGMCLCRHRRDRRYSYGNSTWKSNIDGMQEARRSAKGDCILNMNASSRGLTGLSNRVNRMNEKHIKTFTF